MVAEREDADGTNIGGRPAFSRDSHSRQTEFTDKMLRYFSVRFIQRMISVVT